MGRRDHVRYARRNDGDGPVAPAGRGRFRQNLGRAGGAGGLGAAGMCSGLGCITLYPGGIWKADGWGSPGVAAWHICVICPKLPVILVAIGKRMLMLVQASTVVGDCGLAGIAGVGGGGAPGTPGAFGGAGAPAICGALHPRHLRRLRHSRQLGSFRHPGHLRRWRRLNHVPLPFHFVPFENALAQILHLHAGRRRRGGCSEMRTLGRLRQAGCLRRRWRRRLNRCRLLHVVQHDGLSGGGVRDHGQVAGIDARFSIRRAGESKCRLHRLSARLWRLNRARVFSRNRGSEIWRLWTHCLHRLPRAGCVGAAFPRSGL